VLKIYQPEMRSGEKSGLIVNKFDMIRFRVD